MRRLRGAVEDEVEAPLREEALDPVAVADVEAVVLEPARLAQQPLEVPGRVAVLAEELPAHVVVDAVDGPAALVEEAHGLGPDQPARPGDECGFRHVKGVFGPQRGGRRPGHTRRRRAPAPDPRRRLRGRPRPPLRLHPGLVAALEGALRGGRRPDRDALPRARRRVAVVARGGEPVLLGGRVVRPRAPRRRAPPRRHAPAPRGGLARGLGRRPRRPRDDPPLGHAALAAAPRADPRARARRRRGRRLHRPAEPPDGHPDRAARALRRPGRLLRRRRADEPARVRRHGHGLQHLPRRRHLRVRPRPLELRGRDPAPARARRAAGRPPLLGRRPGAVPARAGGEAARRRLLRLRRQVPARLDGDDGRAPVGAAAGGRVRARGRRLQGAARACDASSAGCR